MLSEACAEELETLSAIFVDEINIKDDELKKGSLKVSIVLYPATADDEESRYVTLTLELFLSPNYPKSPPSIVFRNPRGLNDSMLDDLMECMRERCEERIDSQMIYELIDMGKEFLTKNNRPASECPICLLSFTEFDVFYRTRCFHHFHSHCLGNYLQNLAATFKKDDNVLKGKQNLSCPVCRKCLEECIDIDELLESPPPSEELEGNGSGNNGEAEKVLQEWEEKKKTMKQLFDKQKSQGGIIDLTQGKKRILTISTLGGGGDEGGGGGGGEVAGGGMASSGMGSSAASVLLPASIPIRMNNKGGGKGKITEFFLPKRSSNRKTQEAIREEKQQQLIKLIIDKTEDGLQTKRFSGKGRGVITTKPFLKNEFVVEYAGDLLMATEARTKDAKYARDGFTGCYMYYFSHNNKQYCVDATEESDRLGRLINHSRNGNLTTKVVEVKGVPRLIFIAKRDIEVEEEINYDYGDRSRESIRHHPWLAN